MNEEADASDPIMESIQEAVSTGRVGSTESARQRLLTLWHEIGVAGDPFHRCTLAHYLADLCEDPAQALIWDVRALDAADALSDQRAQQYHATLRVAGFHPSLYLNIADDLRRLGAFAAAADYIGKAEAVASNLSDDAYGKTVRTAIHDVNRSIVDRETARRESAPGRPQ
ncbi:hypothetical protein [Brevibacterium metallidurans]|uniref:Tetratricopeptide repeat protein n=1 Tax=Brevibacterium metallidurans TaxID=1482676 RepID=A0ABN0SLA7_9MICO